MVSVSGGSDSDLVVDMIERIGYPYSQVHYVFFDTGLEFQATKDHLDYLEQKYGIVIQRAKAYVPVPLGVKKYGFPFLSKRVSDYIHRLQHNHFQWEDKSFEELYKQYPNCKVALKWWCNLWGNNSQLNIERNKWLKEFIVQNPPDFEISDKCCNGAKKKTAQIIEKTLEPDLSIIGVRKAEGGARSTAYKTCFDQNFGKCSYLRPVFWFKANDKSAYEQAFSIIHSDCYSKYGLRRTGCACCPFGRNFEEELKCAQVYEPKLYQAANAVFGKSYDYTRKYRQFCREKSNTK